MLLDIIAVVPRSVFQLDLEFENGERRRFDMRPLLAMKPWNRIASPAVFDRVRVDYGTGRNTGSSLTLHTHGIRGQVSHYTPGVAVPN